MQRSSHRSSPSPAGVTRIKWIGMLMTIAAATACGAPPNESLEATAEAPPARPDWPAA